ncbi:hypothetical protein [Gymnodinialimonas sp.]
MDFWKTKAELAERELSKIADDFRALEPTHPHHIHHLFAGLYLCTTRRWLARLSESADSEYAYRVICHFLDLYKDHVLDRLSQPLDSIATYWRTYHRLARRQSIRSPISAHLILISVGARAHTHGDLGQAMNMADQDLGDRIDAHASEQAVRMKIFGEISDKAFFEAALDHVAEQHARQTGWRRMILKLYRVGLYVLKPIWLPVFQRWRRTGYAEAVANAQPRHG